MSMEQNFYVFFGIPTDATDDDIRKAFRKAAKKYHPDSSGDDSTVKLYERAVEGKETLLNPLSRKEYDRSIGLGYRASYDKKKTSHTSSNASSWWSAGTFSADDFVDNGESTNEGNPQHDSWVPPVYEFVDTVVPNWTLPDGFAEGTSYKLFRFEPLVNLVIWFVFLISYGVFLLSSDSMFSGLGVMGFAVTVPLMMRFVRSRHFVWWRGLVYTPVILGALWCVFAAMRVPFYESLIASGLLTVSFHAGWVYNSFKRVLHLHRVFNSKNLTVNNVFGTSGMMSPILNDSLNMVWSIPGVKSVRVDSPVADQLFVFGHSVFMVKVVHPQQPGHLIVRDGGSVVSRYAGRDDELLLGFSFPDDVARISSRIRELSSKSVVYSLVVGFPSQNVIDVSTGSPVTVVRGSDLDELLMSLISSRNSDNFVDRDFLVKVVELVEN